MKALILSLFLHLSVIVLLFFSPWVRPILPEKIRPVFLIPLERPSSPIETALKEEKTKGREEERPIPSKKVPRIEEEKKIEIILGKRVEERLKEIEFRRQKSAARDQRLEVKEEVVKEIPSLEKRAIVIPEAGFLFGWYFTLLEKRITEAWSPPGGFLSADKEATLTFSLTRDGKVKKVSIKKSSGSLIFDRSALKVFEDITDLPPLPSDWKKEELQVIVKFRGI